MKSSLAQQAENAVWFDREGELLIYLKRDKFFSGIEKISIGKSWKDKLATIRLTRILK